MNVEKDINCYCKTNTKSVKDLLKFTRIWHNVDLVLLQRFPQSVYQFEPIWPSCLFDLYGS